MSKIYACFQSLSESGFLGGTSVFFALQDALYSALADAGCPEEVFTLNSPLTAEKICLFCLNKGIAKIM